MQTRTTGRSAQQKNRDQAVATALLNALSQRFEMMGSLLSSLKGKLPVEEAKIKAAQCVRVANEINELCGLIYPPRDPLSLDEAFNFAQGIRALGLNQDQINEAFAMARKKRKGRPATMRSRSIQALEMKLNDPTKSWMFLAMRLCPCNQPEHNTQCRENLRQGVIALKRLLRKYGVKIPGV
jgi:hypothetical protein